MIEELFHPIPDRKLREKVTDTRKGQRQDVPKDLPLEICLQVGPTS